MSDTNDDGLDIPPRLKISPEDRRRAWAEYYRAQAKPAAVSPIDDRGPGSVCRRLGLSDGINKNFVAALEARETAERDRRRAEGLERLAQWKSKQRDEKAAMDRVRAAARA